MVDMLSIGTDASNDIGLFSQMPQKNLAPNVIADLSTR
jgi:hypothetical protein